MQFLNPLMLFGLSAAAIPVILHLLNLRKLKTVEFSTLTFLKELQTTKVRRLKLRQFLLLLLRTLLVITLVLAFSRPTLKGSLISSVGTEARTTAVIILDNTFSMSARNEHGELLKQSKELAIRIVDLMKKGDEVFLIRTAQLPSPVTETPLHDIALIKNLIRETEQSVTSCSYNETFTLTARLLGTSQNTNKEIYFLSDFQNTSWRVRDAMKTMTFGENVRLFTAQFSSGQANVSLDTVAVQTSIIEQNKPVSISVSARNFGGENVHDYALSLFLNGKRVAQKNINIEQWGSRLELFSVPPTSTGWTNGMVELESDVLDEDNRRYFSFYVPENISVAFVAENEEDVVFPLLALKASEDSTQSLFKIQTMYHSQFSRLNLNDVDVIVLSNIPSFSKSDAEQLKSFIEHGGGVVFFPGDKTDIANVNTTLFSVLKIPPFQNILRSADANKGNVVSTVENIDYNHPLFSGVFENSKTKQQQKTIESPLIFEMLQQHVGKEGNVIMAAQSNNSLLSEYSIGSGKLLLYSIAPVLSWSDLPQKGIFVPLAHRSILYCAMGNENSSSFLIGESPSMKIPKQKFAGEKLLSIMNESDTTAQQEVVEGVNENESTNKTIAISRREHYGNYSLFANGKKMGMFSVNIDARESDLRPLPDDAMKKFYTSIGIDEAKVFQLNSPERVEASILESRYGVELWKFCIVCALVFALLEMIIGRVGRKEIEA